HSLRHTAAYRMAEDPCLPLTDVQMVLGHAQMTTTQIYLTQPSGIAPDASKSPGRLLTLGSEWARVPTIAPRLTRYPPLGIPPDAR
ncbi:MAG: site-specific integrase, partial [Actinomycetota bacterium]|nr:site-specific integrase [Actinomycetota bacterium]